MADLSSYINFNIVLNKSGGSPVLHFTDPNHYPAGVANNVTGIVKIVQPDGLIYQGTFTTPDVFFSGGALVQPDLELRLATDGNFQKGIYTITYTVHHPSFTETILIKTVDLEYTPSVPVITDAFDFFTPNLSVTDSTSYGQPGMSFTSVIRSWSALIHSVSGTDQTIVNSGSSFDLAYLGSYYDSQYTVSLTVTPQYLLNPTNDWVTIVDKLTASGTYTTEIPPSLTALLNLLTTLKLSIDTCICGKKCVGCSDCDTLKSTYMLAVSIYTHLIKRGQSSDLAGLSLYVLQLQRLFNNCTSPSYTNTNGVIPAYDWGSSGGGSVSWASITGKPSTVNAEWIVGAGGFPGVGATTYVNAAFANVPAGRIIMGRNSQLQFGSNPGDGDTYLSKNTADNFVTFPALAATEKIKFYILPL